MNVLISIVFLIWTRTIGKFMLSLGITDPRMMLLTVLVFIGLLFFVYWVLKTIRRKQLQKQIGGILHPIIRDLRAIDNARELQDWQKDKDNS